MLHWQTGRKWAAALAMAGALVLSGCATRIGPPPDNDVATCKPSVKLPKWTKKVGARRAPWDWWRKVNVDACGAVADGKTVSTAAIQKAIDKCSKAGGGVVLIDKPGATYVSGALFVKDGVDLRVTSGTTLLATDADKDFPRMPTRIAGVEMTWPSAFINFYGVKNAKVSGGGTIDGNGKKWWDKYLNMRRSYYEPMGVRWASDYDAERVRLMVIWKSSDVTVENLHLRRSGFWTVQVVYSDHVTVNGVFVRDNTGPSTDGVDIDSSSYVLAENCDIDNNDDDFCLKAGRDWDGLRVNLPTEYVVLRNNISRKGAGLVTCGSETSGFIRHVVAYGDLGIGTTEGMRFKSFKTRGGGVEDILITDCKLKNVPLPFSFVTNWNASYSATNIPEGMQNVPERWKTLARPVEPVEKGYPKFRNIRIENVTVENARRMILSADGLPYSMIEDIHWKNIVASGAKAGNVNQAKNWTFENVTFKTPDGQPLHVTNSTNIGEPKLVVDSKIKPLDAKTKKLPKVGTTDYY
jgi:polygalacturonase